MVGSESAVCVAGNINYLFFNKDDSDSIDYFRVSEDERVPQHNKIPGVSNGGAIACVYHPKKDEILLYFISKEKGDDGHVLMELMLSEASNMETAHEWTYETSALTPKGFPIHSESMLQATLDADGEPRVFYRQNKKDDVYFAEYRCINVKYPDRKDWTTTKFTGFGR